MGPEPLTLAGMQVHEVTPARQQPQTLQQSASGSVLEQVKGQTASPAVVRSHQVAGQDTFSTCKGWGRARSSRCSVLYVCLAVTARAVRPVRKTPNSAAS